MVGVEGHASRLARKGVVRAPLEASRVEPEAQLVEIQGSGNGEAAGGEGGQERRADPEPRPAALQAEPAHPPGSSRSLPEEHPAPRAPAGRAPRARLPQP